MTDVITMTNDSGASIPRRPTVAGASRYNDHDEDGSRPNTAGFVFDDDKVIQGSVPLHHPIGSFGIAVEKSLPSASPNESQAGSVPLQEVTTTSQRNQEDPFGIDLNNGVHNNRGPAPSSPLDSSRKRPSEQDWTPTSEKRSGSSNDVNGDPIISIHHMLHDITNQLSTYGNEIRELHRKVDDMTISEHAAPHNDLSMDSIPPPNADESTLIQWISNQGTYPRLVREALYMFPGGTRHDRSSVLERMIEMAYGYREGSSQNHFLLSKFLSKLRQLKQYIRDVVAHPLVKQHTVMYLDVHKEVEQNPDQAAAVWMHHPPTICDPLIAGAVIGKICGVLTKGKPIMIQNNASMDNWSIFIIAINLITMKRGDSGDSDHDIYSTIATAIFPMTRFDNLSTRFLTARREAQGAAH